MNPGHNLISYTLEQMQSRLAERIASEQQTGQRDKTNVRSGLLFMGNVHDAIPRRLMLDSRLSPLDKTAWIMIRLYAQHDQGAIFPTYDELQLQLASPYSGKASRETVSRVLLMLRLTGRLSLCRRELDTKGRVRGNIYAQHDEPLSAHDAEALDPTWLDTVANACRHHNRTINQTAWAVLSDIQQDPLMRHHHSYIVKLAERLTSPQTPQQLAEQVALSSDTEPSANASFKPSSNTELSENRTNRHGNSDTEPSQQSSTYAQTTKPNCYVRSFTQSVNKTTYVPVLPEELRHSMAENDYQQVMAQLQALPAEAAQKVLASLAKTMDRGGLKNSTGWLLAVIKRARNGELYGAQAPAQSAGVGSNQSVVGGDTSSRSVQQMPASKAYVSDMVAKLRQKMVRARDGDRGD